MQTLISLPVHQLLPDDKLYDFSHRGYDIIRYIDKEDHNKTGEYFFTYDAFNDGIFKEDTKDYSNYIHKDANVYILVEVDILPSVKLIYTPISLLNRGDTIYLHKEEVLGLYKIKDIAGATDGFTQTREKRSALCVDSKGKEIEILLSLRVHLAVDVNKIVQCPMN